MSKEGSQFLHQKDSKLHTSPEVEYEKKRQEVLSEKTGSEKPSQKPAEKIGNFLSVLEQTHGHHKDPRVLERIKQDYHKRFVIKPEDIPESVFLLEQRIARDLGHGTIELTDEFRHEKTQQIINAQEQSLDKWVDYLSGQDALYPTWAKYWAFRSIVKMGKLEKEEDENGKLSAKYTNRTKGTSVAFPILNQAALALTFGVMSKRLEWKQKVKAERTPQENESKKLTDEDFQKLLSTEDFSKIYTQFLIELPEYSKEGLEETRGVWKVFKKGTDPKELVDSLEGYPLEWCTADYNTAKSQLQGGDFHVYYSINDKGKAVIPRLAIRMSNQSIAEVRGIAPNQNVDPYISTVVKEKMKEFPDGAKYEKKSDDMKHLTEIQAKHEQKQELTKEDFRFLYQVDSRIQGFGYGVDPRVQEILMGRDTKDDLSFVFDCRKDQVSTTTEEALSGNILFHHGGLSLYSLTSAEGLTLPKATSGDLYLSSLTSAEGLTLPETLGGSLNLSRLTSAEGLTLPKAIGGDLDLYSLTSAEGLTFPETIGGYLDLRNLTSAEGLTLPESIGGNLNLDSLTSAKGLTLPKSIRGDLNLHRLTSAEGLTLPKAIGGNLDLSSLTSAEGLTLPETIYGNFDLKSLTSAKGLTLPKAISGSLDLGRLPATEKEKLIKERPDLRMQIV